MLHNNNSNNNNKNNNHRLTAFDRDNPGRLVPEETFTHSHPSGSSYFLYHLLSICNGPWHPLYSTYVPDSPHVQPLSRSCLVFLLVLNPQLHAPYISSPSHHHLFATHDRILVLRHCIKLIVLVIICGSQHFVI